MTANLYLHGRKLTSVFELLGSKENDFTYSVGWAFSRCPTFLESFLKELFPHLTTEGGYDILLQEHVSGGGFTDIEIKGDHVHVIVEAKRGWELPSVNQLKQYRPRINNHKSATAIVALSECSHDYAKAYMHPIQFNRVPVMYRNWADIARLSKEGRSYAEKRLLEELRTYIRRYVNMQKQELNWVYVVSLSSAAAAPGLSYVDIVTKKNRYFHRYGSTGGWPSDPPNYLGFRYDGRLQRIHHVESYKIIRNYHDEFPEFPNKEEKDFQIIYKLGPKIVPSQIVKTGKVYASGRVWAMLDTLLTCSTVAEARDLSAQRLSEE